MTTKRGPGKPRALSLEQAEGARRRYVDAKTPPAALASELSVSVGTMLAVLMCTGTYANDGPAVKERSVRYRGHQKLSDENVREIRRLRRDGVSYEDLGVRFGINPGTAMNVTTRTDRFALVDPLLEDAVSKHVSPQASRELLVAKVEHMILAGRSAAQIVDFVKLSS